MLAPMKGGPSQGFRFVLNIQAQPLNYKSKFKKETEDETIAKNKLAALVEQNSKQVVNIDFAGPMQPSGAIWDTDTGSLNIENVILEEIAEKDNTLARSQINKFNGSFQKQKQN